MSEILPELKQLETNAKENAEKWKSFEETEEFKQVYQAKTIEQRDAAAIEERERANSLDDDEQCTIEPVKL